MDKSRLFKGLVIDREIKNVPTQTDTAAVPSTAKYDLVIMDSR